MKFYNPYYTGSPILGTTPVASYGCPSCPGYGAERTIEQAEFERGREEMEYAPAPAEKKTHWGVWAALGLLGAGVIGGIIWLTR